ncbi:MAG: hypothetical protein Q4B91_03495 [Atopobiaceae bacterium]|nr:hypothetical protein [Atopobiaceae bacterium]
MSFTPIQTQEEFDRAIKERMDRLKGQYADYDELKAKAAKFDEAEEARKRELDKANGRIAELEAAARGREEADRLSALRSKVAEATGVPAELISGTDEDSMTESAEAISAFAKRTVPPAPNVGGAGAFAGEGASAGGAAEGFARDLDRALFGEGSE